MNNIKKVLIIMTVITTQQFWTSNIYAETIPRIGVNFGKYYLEEFVSGVSANNVVLGPTAGVLFTINDDFIDISSEVYTFTTDTDVSVQRTEIAATYGARVYKSLYTIIGYQMALFGEGFLKSNIGTSSGPFAGASVNNLRMGQDSTNVFSIALAVQLLRTEYLSQESSDVSFNIKLGYREANQPHSFSFKFQTFGSEFHAEWISLFNYSHQFSSF